MTSSKNRGSSRVAAVRGCGKSFGITDEIRPGRGDMTTMRENHTTTLLSDGRVLIAGGVTGSFSSITNTAELYDPITGVFTPTGEMTTPRRSHAAALLPFSPYTEMASLPESRVRGDVLQVVKNLGSNVLVLQEGGGAGVPQPRAGEVVLFTSFLTAGLAPPFSEFLKYVLSYYGIHLAHLVPNSIVILSTFAHF